MSAEDRTDNVNNALLAWITVDRNDNGSYGWHVSEQPYGHPNEEILLRGSHETEADAIAAAIKYIRMKRPDIVRAASKEAAEGERYRSAEKS